MDLFRKKSVDQLVAESTPLKRTMRTFDLTMLGIGAIIGTGIFVLTGKGALTASPALSVSFLLAAVCCGFAGLCYAEFAAMAPVSGSACSRARSSQCPTSSECISSSVSSFLPLIRKEMRETFIRLW